MIVKIKASIEILDDKVREPSQKVRCDKKDLKWERKYKAKD